MTVSISTGREILRFEKRARIGGRALKKNQRLIQIYDNRVCDSRV